MSEISRSSLFGKLNPLAYKSFEGATVFCKLRGNPYVELVHWIHQLLSGADSDLHRITQHFRLDRSRLKTDLDAALDRLPRGATSISDLSSHLENAVERGWVYASLMFNQTEIRTGVLLIGILKTPSLRQALLAVSAQFDQINIDEATDRFGEITKGSPEDDVPANTAAQPGPADIFICYRRNDSNHFTGRIFDRLANKFGHDRVFMDVNSIDAGTKDFAKEIRQRLQSASVMLVMVGRAWLADDKGRSRLDDKSDYVRRELRWGLTHEVRVVPILLDGATMPETRTLPVALRPFAKCQAINVRSDAEFERDVQHLISELAGRLSRPQLVAKAQRAATSVNASQRRGGS